MVRVLALFAAAVLMLTGCASKYYWKEEVMDDATYQRYWKMYQKYKPAFDRKLDRELIKEEVSGRAGLKAFALQVVTSVAGGVIGKSAVAAQVAGRALDLAGNMAFAVKDITAKGNRFSAIVFDYDDTSIKIKCKNRVSTIYYIPKELTDPDKRGYLKPVPPRMDAFRYFIGYRFGVTWEKGKPYNPDYIRKIYTLQWIPWKDRFFYAHAPYWIGVIELWTAKNGKPDKLIVRGIYDGLTGSAVFSRDIITLIKKDDGFSEWNRTVSKHYHDYCKQKQKLADKD